MKHFCIVLFFLFILPQSSTAQKLNEYQASNGINYLVGDTITLGVGSACDGFFRDINSSIVLTKLMSFVEEEGYDPRLPSGYEGSKVEIIKIRQSEGKTYLVFTSDDLGNFLIDIEAAIKSCEVAYCQQEGFLTQQQFEKLVLLYQACQNGTIGNEKFEELRREMIGGGK